MGRTPKNLPRKFRPHPTRPSTLHILARLRLDRGRVKGTLGKYIFLQGSLLKVVLEVLLEVVLEVLQLLLELLSLLQGL